MSYAGNDGPKSPNPFATPELGCLLSVHISNWYCGMCRQRDKVTMSRYSRTSKGLFSRSQHQLKIFSSKALRIRSRIYSTYVCIYVNSVSYRIITLADRILEIIQILLTYNCTYIYFSSKVKNAFIIIPLYFKLTCTDYNRVIKFSTPFAPTKVFQERKKLHS